MESFASADPQRASSADSFWTTENRALLEIGRHLTQAGYRFTTVTPETHGKINSRAGNALAKGLRCIFGWSRPFDRTQVPLSLFAAMDAAGVLKKEGAVWRSTVRATSLGDRLYFHSAFPTVHDDAVFFGPDTYRFVAAIRHRIDDLRLPVRRVADIGCGAGAGAIEMAIRFPEAEVVAVDINERALRMASINARLAQADNVLPCRSDLLRDVGGNFDLIIANPPYLVDPGQRLYRHGGGEDGSGLSFAILDTALSRLNPGGRLVLYTGVAISDGRDPFREAVAERLTGHPAAWRYEEVDPDVFGEELLQPAYALADRIAVVTLTLTCPG